MGTGGSPATGGGGTTGFTYCSCNCPAGAINLSDSCYGKPGQYPYPQDMGGTAGRDDGYGSGGASAASNYDDGGYPNETGGPTTLGGSSSMGGGSYELGGGPYELGGGPYELGGGFTGGAPSSVP